MPEERQAQAFRVIVPRRHFFGLSAPNVLTPDHGQGVADKPFDGAQHNPDPEIMPDEARKARHDQ